jgi:hypothetical protein
MSPLSGGLAEVDRRLRYLQRRLNEFTLLHAVCVGLSGVVLVSAGVIVLGLRADPAIFRIGSGAAALLVVAVAVACAVFLRRRWMDAGAVAWVADRRGGLTDRLTTLMALQRRPRSSCLMPLLVKQILVLSPGWQPDRIQPRRFPRSVFLLVASFLVLGATAWVSRHEPPPPVSQPAPQPQVGPKAAPVAPVQQQRRGVGQQSAGETDVSTEELGDLQADADSGESGGAARRGEDRPVSIAALPDRLQAAIRQAFDAQPLDHPRPLSGRSPSTPGETRQGSNGREDGGGAGETRQGAPPRPDSAAAGRLQRGESGPGKPTGQGGKGSDPGAEQQRNGGSSPGAGSGSSPGGLMGPEGSEAALGGAGSTRFKLTITSFLRGAVQRNQGPRPPGARVGGAHGAPQGGAATAALSDRQLADDLLRKAEIPPEYEDIVRRVYSAKAGK